MSVLMKNDEMLAALVPSVESVSVTSDGTMTYNSIFNALFALVDVSKLSVNSKLEDAKSGNVNIYAVTQYTSTQIRASKAQTGSGFSCEEAILNASTSTYYHAEGSTTQDWGTAKPSSGHVFTLYY